MLILVNSYYAPQIFSSVSRSWLYLSIVLNMELDRLHWHQELSSRLRNLWYRQSRCNYPLHLRIGGFPRSKIIAIHISYWNGHTVLYRRCDLEDPSPSSPTSRHVAFPTAGFQGNGCNALYICLFLFDGLGYVEV